MGQGRCGGWGTGPVEKQTNHTRTKEQYMQDCMQSDFINGTIRFRIDACGRDMDMWTYTMAGSGAGSGGADAVTCGTRAV